MQPQIVQPQIVQPQMTRQPYYPQQVPLPTPQPVYMVQPMVPAAIPSLSIGNGIGTAAGVLGIISAVLMFVPVINYISVILGTLAIIFGARGSRRARLYPGTPRGMAVTGLVLGIISVVVALIFIIGVYAYVFRDRAPWI